MMISRKVQIISRAVGRLSFSTRLKTHHLATGASGQHCRKPLALLYPFSNHPAPMQLFHFAHSSEEKKQDSATKSPVTQSLADVGEVSTIMPPQVTLAKAANAGLLRGQRSSAIILVSSIMGGALLSFGGSMFCLVSGGTMSLIPSLPGLHSLLGAAVFPIGLSLVIFTGSELLTSNMFYHTLPFLTHAHRDVNLKTLGKVLGLSAIGNFIGSVAIAAYASNYIFLADPYTTWATAIAVKKTSLSAGTAFMKGIGANWLVNVAVYMALSSRSAGGKMVSLWLPITTFVALGLEHCVANAFLIPLGMFSGADVSIYDMFSNLIPVAGGNFVGAVLFVSVGGWFTDWYPARARPEITKMWTRRHIFGRKK
eukprot:m.345243 g.345243  ORF g.345243 m.345243 type:complete len:368 (+) comp25978_c0_seq1:279-1382(+)